MLYDAVLEIRHLRLRYGRELPLVLDDISLMLRANEKVGIFGPSGMLC